MFGQVSFSQVKIMEHILESFCLESGQLMNRNKSVLWFSPNTPGYLKHSISSGLRVTCTTSLGTYLGVPIIHGMIRRDTYQYLIDRVQRKLGSWKINLLSKVARLVLIQTTLQAIPVHAMQSTAIPRSIVGAIERICGGFLWGDQGTTHTLHAVNWGKICRPRNVGGLDLSSLWSMNRALLTKVGWRKLTMTSTLRSRILTEKYEHWQQSTTN